MKRLQFKVSIDTSADQVYDKMLGLTQKLTYEQWTAVFNPTSTYEGNWKKGEKMRFIGTDEKGEKGGLVSEIVDNVPNRFVSIRHYGLVKGNAEITEGPEVEKWANGLENYNFEENSGSTTVKVDLDITDEFQDYMEQTYPKALDKLKELCEK